MGTVLLPSSDREAAYRLTVEQFKNSQKDLLHPDLRELVRRSAGDVHLLGGHHCQKPT